MVDEETDALQSKIQKVPAESEDALNRTLHKTIKKVVEDTEGMRFNTAISQMMVFANEATAAKTLPHDIIQPFVRIVSAYAPHLAEELWERLGEKGLVAHADLPVYDPALCTEDSIELVIQVNGKKRGTLTVAKTASKEELEKLALESPMTAKFLEGKAPKRVIVVPGRLVNIVG